MNRPTEHEVRLAWRILSWVGMIEHLSRTRASRALEAIGLPFPQFVVLNHFQWRPGEPQTVSRIAGALQQPQPGITKTVQKVIARRFVRARTSPSDGRSKELFITPKGLEAHGKALEGLVPAYRDLFAGWNPAEMEDLFAKLDRLKSWLDTTGREGPPIPDL